MDVAHSMDYANLEMEGAEIELCNSDPDWNGLKGKIRRYMKNERMWHVILDREDTQIKVSPNQLKLVKSQSKDPVVSNGSKVLQLPGFQSLVAEMAKSRFVIALNQRIKERVNAELHEYIDNAVPVSAISTAFELSLKRTRIAYIQECVDTVTNNFQTIYQLDFIFAAEEYQNPLVLTGPPKKDKDAPIRKLDNFLKNYPGEVTEELRSHFLKECHEKSLSECRGWLDAFSGELEEQMGELKRELESFLQ